MLTGREILKNVLKGSISIEPFHTEQVNPNSYDIRLGSNIFAVSDSSGNGNYIYPVIDKKTGLNKITLDKGLLYLCSTIERVGSEKFIPVIDGKSTLARLGLSIHLTAGIGDIGFINKWTLEITTIYRIDLYIGMKIGQVYFIKPEGDVSKEFLYKGSYKDINTKHHNIDMDKIIDNDINFLTYNSNTN